MAAALLLTFLAPRVAAAAPGKSIVSLSVTYQLWDQRRPWAKLNPRVRHASAVVVPGPYLLTTAEILASATYVRLEKFGRPTNATARVAFLDPEVNLALLAVEDAGFFDDLAPVALAPRTPVGAALRTIRWQDQQLELAATRPKRVRVEPSYLGRLEHAFLEVQTDISGGGWAEPVFAEDALVGLAVSQEKDQRARVLPVEVVALFLKRARAPAYVPFPVFGVQWQANTHAALASFLGQAGEPRGIVVRRVPWGSSGCGVLEPLDVVLSIDGVELDAEGYYRHPYLGQLLFPHLLVERSGAGSTVEVAVLRGGRTLRLPMTLRRYPASLDLVPEIGGIEPPPYLVAGGLVLRELDVDYLRSWGSEWHRKAPLRLLLAHDLEQRSQRPDRRRIVILSHVLPSAYTVGYQDARDLVVEAINGRPIGDIADVREAFGAPENGFHTIVFRPNTQRREITLDAAGLEAATAKAMEAHAIPAAFRPEAAASGRESAAAEAGPPCEAPRSGSS